MGKLLNHAQQLFDITGLLRWQSSRRYATRYRKAKDKFEEIICKNCAQHGAIFVVHSRHCSMGRVR